MNTPGYVVYWLEASGENARPQFGYFKPDEMTQALNFMNELRNRAGVGFVTFASQDANSVGKPGVDSIIDGKTPDGHPYEWSKQHRAGATRKR